MTSEEEEEDWVPLAYGEVWGGRGLGFPEAKFEEHSGLQEGTG